MKTITLKAFWNAATPFWRHTLAERAGIAYNQLYQIVAGIRHAKAGTAIKLHEASKKIPDMDPIAIETICPDCRECPYRRAAVAK